MQLTKQTDFAFRTLIYLAELPEDKLSHVKDVCDFYDISPNHISKVVVKLVKLGYVEAHRGKGGGIKLGMAPENISLAQVVEEFETTLNPVNCMTPRCRIVKQCRLKGLLNDAMKAFLDTLKDYSLADLLGPQKKLIAST